MTKCVVCNHMGANMKQCTKCGKIWCLNCAMSGKAPYPKQRAYNVCPYCGKMDCVKPAT